MIDANPYLDKLGGTRAAARALGLASATVHSWRANGLPKWRVAAVQAAVDALTSSPKGAAIPPAPTAGAAVMVAPASSGEAAD
jgi:hypothetical protein